MDAIDFHALALEVEDALFAADLKESELRVARLIVKLSLRWSRTTTPKMLQKDFGDGAGIRESHIAQTLGWLLGKKIILLERADVYRINSDPQTWLVPNRVSAEWRMREHALMAEEYKEFWSLDAIRAGDPTVAFRDAEVEVHAERVAAENFRNSEVGALPKFGSLAEFSQGTSEIRKSPIDYSSIGQAKACLLPVQETGELSAREEKKPNPVLDEQIGRVERILGSSHLHWWRQEAGRSPEHTTALRQTLDDLRTNRQVVRDASRWCVSVFKNKIRAIRQAVHLFFA